jgi:hypothetical protein
MVTLEQARLVPEGRRDAVDRNNVAEEIESSGREQFNKLEGVLRVLMLHMLKWDHQPALRSRSWVLSIETQRLELADVIADNPGLRLSRSHGSRLSQGATRSRARDRTRRGSILQGLSLFLGRHRRARLRALNGLPALEAIYRSA